MPQRRTRRVSPAGSATPECRGKRKLLWNRFRVDAVTGKIGIYQMVIEEFIPIDLWRVKIGQE